MDSLPIPFENEDSSPTEQPIDTAVSVEIIELLSKTRYWLMVVAVPLLIAAFFEVTNALTALLGLTAEGTQEPSGTPFERISEFIFTLVFLLLPAVLILRIDQKINLFIADPNTERLIAAIQPTTTIWRTLGCANILLICVMIIWVVIGLFLQLAMLET